MRGYCLPIVGKLLEKHIHRVISEHLNEYSTLSSHQWGFQSGTSTMALTRSYSGLVKFTG